MTVAVDPEVLQAAAVALLLVGAAAGLDVFARGARGPAGGRRVVGFRYWRELNAWQCSEGYFLWLREVDHTRRIARYRACAETCNQCAAKRFCTESHEGRELAQSLDHLPRPEEGQFQRGLSLLVLAVGAAVLLVEAWRHHQHTDLLLLAIAFGLLLAVSRVTLRHFLKWGRYIEQPEGLGL